MPLEVLTIIEGVQKRLDQKFTTEEIEQGVLKDVIIDDDYDLVQVVSLYILLTTKISWIAFKNVRTHYLVLLSKHHV